MRATIKFRPVERETLELLVSTHQQEGDPVDTYSRLLTAAAVSGALLNLQPEDIAEHARPFADGAVLAVCQRADIFGGMQPDIPGEEP